MDYGPSSDRGAHPCDICGTSYGLGEWYLQQFWQWSYASNNSRINLRFILRKYQDYLIYNIKGKLEADRVINLGDLPPCQISTCSTPAARSTACTAVPNLFRSMYSPSSTRLAKPFTWYRIWHELLLDQSSPMYIVGFDYFWASSCCRNVFSTPDRGRSFADLWRRYRHTIYIWQPKGMMTNHESRTTNHEPRVRALASEITTSTLSTTPPYRGFQGDSKTYANVDNVSMMAA